MNLKIYFLIIFIVIPLFYNCNKPIFLKIFCTEDLSGRFLILANLTDANLTRANLNNTDLGDNTFLVNLINADLRYAHFSDTDFKRAKLQGAIFITNATIDGVTYSTNGMLNADFTGAILTNQ